MARMHSRKKGRSGSTRPARLEKPVWVELSPEEVENEVVKLARKGYSKSMIGNIMRDSRGVPLVRVVAGKKISQILTENDIKAPLPEELVNLVKKALSIRKHLEENHKDLESKKGLNRTESKIYRLIKYYKKKKVLAPDFKYDPEKIRTLVAR
ncbi:MAG: 30S ribosomal protein S15 [Candidatus Lokiarchaeota archaeon]|nr:30S ribosomal protein S15 [Candidatus Lokiarchaeota archaeon]